MPINPNRLEKLHEQNIKASTETLLRMYSKGRLGDIALSGIDDSPASTFEATANPETEAAFITAFRETEQLFNRIGTEPPALEEFAIEDLTHLFSSYEEMQAEGLLPQIVLTSAHFGLNEARALYEHLRRDSTIKNNPLGERPISAHLIDIYMHRYPRATLPPQDCPCIIDWSLRLIPGKSIEFDSEQAGYFGSTGNYFAPIPPKNHPTIGEYLTLQARLIQAGRPTLDDSSYTWLSSHYVDGGELLAVDGRLDRTTGRLFLGLTNVDANEMEFHHLRTARY